MGKWGNNLFCGILGEHFFNNDKPRWWFRVPHQQGTQTVKPNARTTKGPDCWRWRISSSRAISDCVWGSTQTWAKKKPKSSAFLGHAASYGWDDAEQLKEWRDKKWWSIGFHMKRITRRFGGRLPIPRARDTWILRRQGLSHKILWNGYPPVIKCGSGKFHMYRCFSNL